MPVDGAPMCAEHGYPALSGGPRNTTPHGNTWGVLTRVRAHPTARHQRRARTRGYRMKGKPKVKPKVKPCVFCGEEILAAAIKCKHCGSMLDGSTDPEQTLADVGANLFRGIESVGGRLKITTRRLLFEPHAVGLQKNPAEILLSDIAAVAKRNTAGFVPNGMSIRTKGGVEYKFVVWGRDKLIDLISTRTASR